MAHTGSEHVCVRTAARRTQDLYERRTGDGYSYPATSPRSPSGRQLRPSSPEAGGAGGACEGCRTLRRPSALKRLLTTPVCE